MPGLNVPHLCAFFRRLKPTATSAPAVYNGSTSFLSK